MGLGGSYELKFYTSRVDDNLESGTLSKQ